MREVPARATNGLIGGSPPGRILSESRLEEVMDVRESNRFTNELTEPDGLGRMGRYEARIFAWSESGIKKEAA